MDKTKKYYKENSLSYFNKTKDADIDHHYNEFLNFINPNDTILDLGCGSGRDSFYFKNLGYKTLSYDYTSEFNSLAKKEFDVDIQNIDMRNINDTFKFNAIWAMASLLHLTQEEINHVLKLLYNSLKNNGIIYASFKLNPSKEKRHFLNLPEQEIIKIFENNNFKLLKTYLSKDELNRGIIWLNLICKKINL